LSLNRDEIIKKCIYAAKQMRFDVVKMTHIAGIQGAHIGGGLSMIEITAVLYCGVMKLNSEHPEWEERDRFILSKGHCALAQYAALRQIGIIEEEDLNTFKQNDTKLSAHLSMNPAIGIEFSSGSLGQGLSLGVGTCLALRRKNNTSSRIFVLLGDGECNEGQVWEAAISAAHYKLDNLIVIIDKNGMQYDGATSDVLSMEPISDKWAAFGFDVVTVDGHDVEALYDTLTTLPKNGKPVAIVANTIKGKGISYMENHPKYHSARLSQEEYENVLSELGKV